MSERTVGVLAYGAYIPRLRLQRAAVVGANSWFNAALQGFAKGERAMSNWDEDALTMAVEASRDCLTDLARTQVSSVVLASTSLPNADRQNSGIVKEALNLSDKTGSLDVGGSQRAGTSALIQSINSAAGSGAAILCVAAEKRKARPASEAELLSGDAAAALLVGCGEPIARFVGSHSVTADFVDHFRATGSEFDYAWESRWVRDEGYGRIVTTALSDALAALDMTPASVDHLIIPVTARNVVDGLAKRIGIAATAVRDTLGATVGDTGVAHPVLMLVHALEDARAGERIVVVGFGQGCDVLVFEVTDAITRLPKRLGVSGWLSRRKPEHNYLRYLFFNGLLDLERGMRAEFDQKQSLTALYRNRKAVLGLVGGRCTKTGTIQFPRSEVSVDTSHHAVGTQEDYPLAERSARIITHTADNLTYTPDPPAYYGMVEFEGGGRMVAEFADVDPELLTVGRSVRMMFRIMSADELRGFTKYFWKATPLA